MAALTGDEAAAGRSATWILTEDPTGSSKTMCAQAGAPGWHPKPAYGVALDTMDAWEAYGMRTPEKRYSMVVHWTAGSIVSNQIPPSFSS